MGRDKFGRRQDRALYLLLTDDGGYFWRGGHDGRYVLTVEYIRTKKMRTLDAGHEERDEIFCLDTSRLSCAMKK